MGYDIEKEKREAIEAGRRALNSLSAAKENLNSAKNWGLVDMFGGGFFSTMLKHSKMDHAKQNMDQAKYDLRNFSRELNERKIIKENFEKGYLQGIVAIKCLDEGVNIPNIKTVFILASTTNPKEYIQRRGRVLRKTKDIDKEFAEIYDFITLPRELDSVQYLTKEQLKLELSLVKKEILRMEEFSRLAINSIVTQEIIWNIKKIYKGNILYFEEEDKDGEYY